MKEYVLEVCADSVESAIAAQEGGADRIELCSNLIVGGVTPGLALFHLVQKYTDLHTRILLRPRYGDYCYNAYEFEQLKEEAQMYKEAGACGIVIGMLNPDGSLDTERMGEITEAAGTMEIALHRAFDVCVNPLEAMEQAISLGMHTILTSGQCESAWEGRELLRQLAEKGSGKIEILAAGGIVAEEIEKLIPYTGITSYHMSGKVGKDSAMRYRNLESDSEGHKKNEYLIWQTSAEKVKQAVLVLDTSCKCKGQ